MKNTYAAALVCALASLASPSHAAPDPADRAKIAQVVETFRVAIIKKDKDSFMKLFYSETIPWLGVETDASLALGKAQNPSLPAMPKVSAEGSPRKFIDSIVKRTEAIEETFDNVRIDSDGDVAQVWFDYVYKSNNYKQNWGKEAWHLVRTANGWKINSVIFSMEFNPEPPPKLEKKKS